jgi:hypothetical protein
MSEVRIFNLETLFLLRNAFGGGFLNFVAETYTAKDISRVLRY